ncbi:MAG TPA: glycogen debranching N-terminal domain-containing protein, partial [Dehalococcoidia bacterium]
MTEQHAQPQAPGRQQGTLPQEERDGSVLVKDSHGFGLYYHDCRYLNGYELRLAGTEPHPLVSTAARGYMAVFELT